MVAGDDVMKSFPDILWFLLCGARERLARMGAFGVAGLVMTVYSDVMGPRKDTVWVRGLIFTSLSLLLVLAVFLVGRRHRPLTTTAEGTDPPRRATKTQPALPKPLHWGRDLALFGLITAVQLFGTGIGQILLGTKVDASDTRSVSLFATLIPELQRLRQEVAGVRENLEHVDKKLDTVKRETSDDPRKELANMGIAWTVDAFFDAIRRGDRRTVDLFVAGKMTTGAPDSHGRPLPVILALNTENAGEMLDVLVAGGLDIEHPYKIWAVGGDHKSTLLTRAIEEGNLQLVEALIRHKVHTDDPIQTYGMMGITANTYPLAAAIYWKQITIAEALLKAGADPSIGDYAAYRQAWALAHDRKQPKEITAGLNSLMPGLKPKGKNGERVENELLLQVVEQNLNEIALDQLRAVPDSSESARLDKEYQLFQQERQRLRTQLGITSD